MYDKVFCPVSGCLSFMAPFYRWGSTASRLQSHDETVYFLPISSQKFLVLIYLFKLNNEAPEQPIKTVHI